MKESISAITLGIRYRRSFKMTDISGEIIDRLIQDEHSPFDENTFTQVGDLAGGRGKVMINQEEKTSLTIDIDSIVLTLPTKDVESTIKKIKEVYYPFFVKVVFDEFDVSNINRLGLIFEHKIDKLDSINTMVTNFTGQKIEKPDNFELRFSKKLPTKEGLINKDIIDFYNTIFTYEKNSKGFDVKLDYQLYFAPEIAKVRDVPFGKFVDSAQAYLLNTFYKW